MESQPQNPEFRNNPENFHPWVCYLIYSIEFHITASKEANNMNPDFGPYCLQHRPPIYGSR